MSLRYSPTAALRAAALAVLAAVAPLAHAPAADLAETFRNPPDSAKVHTWWHWMDGNISKAGITADLEAMASAGVGGAQIFNVGQSIPNGPATFNSPLWFDMVKHAHAEAKRLGVELCLHNCAGWANSGGPWNTPEHGMKIVVVSEQHVRGPATITAPPPPAKHHPGFYRDIAVVAFPTPAKPAKIDGLAGKLFRNRREVRAKVEAAAVPGSTVARAAVVNLSQQLLAPPPNGSAWQVPAGDWTILRVGYTANGRGNHPAPKGGHGLEVDKLSRTAVKAHWDGHMAKVLAAVGPLDPTQKTGINNVLIDSYEVGTQNWTQGFENDFRNRRGYDIIPFLPVFAGRVVDSPEVTERFLWDLRRVIADMFAEIYSGYFGEIAHKNGLLYSIEPYGDCPSDDLQYGSYSDIPMGEFWQSDGHSVNSDNAKLPASIAHIYGKKYVGAEAFTAAPKGGRWIKDAFALKAQNDAALCSGINRMIYHRFAHQPWLDRFPGMTMGQWGTHFERTLTWWKQGKEWLTYQARCQYLLQEGRFVADVLFYTGEDAPNGSNGGALPRGYDYDSCDTRALSLLSVNNGKLTLPSGMEYRVLALPNSITASPEVLTQIKRLADAGAVIVGNKPLRAPGLAGYPASDAKVRQLANELWGKGAVSTKSPADALLGLGVKPDFADNEPGANIRYIHRTAAGADIYFVATQNLAGAEATATFRVSGKVPELWHPDTGRVETAPIWSEKDGLTSLPLRFAACGSVFVVFRQPSANVAHAVSSTFKPAPRKNAAAASTLKIVKATYGVFPDYVPPNCMDVTEKVKKVLASGADSFSAGSRLAGDDPAPGVIKDFWLRYSVNGVEKTVREKEKGQITVPKGAKIIKAVYGKLGDTEPVTLTALKDVTAQVAAAVQGGTLRLNVSNETLGGAPAGVGNIPQELRVAYTLDGELSKTRALERGILRLPAPTGVDISAPDYELRAPRRTGANANAARNVPLFIRAWEPGTFEIKFADGKTLAREVPAVPAPVALRGPWELSFPPNWGAPAKVTLPKLISWTEHTDDGVKYFSGTATYRKTFTWDAPRERNKRFVLDLGDLKNFAEVSLNGHAFPVLWKPPYRHDISRWLKDGENKLEVKITNLWPNRLIGDEYLPDDRQWRGKRLVRLPQWVTEGKPSPTGRFTFTTWHHWNKGDKPLPSGLFGPVLIRTIVVAPVAPAAAAN
ncbi:MAG: hypothetical protein LBT53_05205 [Puniceicoccales bacterium]|jgi:hypothetical protein|nr:hypothetical protein [Puniceicoccales bacterium]